MNGERIAKIEERLSALEERANQVNFLDNTSQNIIGDYVKTLDLGGEYELVIEFFTSSGTWTVPAGVTEVIAEGVGGGAGSGWSSNTFSGGGGAYCLEKIDLSGVTSVSYTIGAGGTAQAIGGTPAATNGGDTTFGAYFTAGGGQTNGNGGTATGGDINIPGENAGQFIQYSYRTTASNDGLSGKGGDSMWGWGGKQAHAAAGGNYTAGNAGTGYGAGASSAANAGGGGADAAGAAGTSGAIKLTYIKAI